MKVCINHSCPFCVQAQETAQLEEQLQGWGEVILAGDRVVRWEKPWFPGALMGGITALFLWVSFTVYCNMTLHTAWCIPELTKCAVPPSQHWTLLQNNIKKYHHWISLIVLVQIKFLARRRNLKALWNAELSHKHIGLDLTKWAYVLFTVPIADGWQNCVLVWEITKIFHK